MSKPSLNDKHIRPITSEEIRAAAQTFQLDLSNDEVAMYTEFMGSAAASYQTVAEADAPKLPVRYPREAGYQPSPEENPLNAWAWKATIRGADQGKLAGKRVVIKDNVCVADLPLLNGSDVFEDFIPDEDATVVTRILDAGGEILGKAVCEDFCYSGGSHTSASGPVKNPRNPEFMAGGSSSGCAALLVSGECDMAIGSDQGGSVRMPSSFSGCYGIKPTYGLVPYTGAFGIDVAIDHLGPMANSTYDCALLLEVIAGYDEGLDPRQGSHLEAKRYTDSLSGDAKGLKIGVVTEGFGTWGAETDVDEMVRDAAYRLERAGAHVADVAIPMHAQAGPIFEIIIGEGSMINFSDSSGAGTLNKGHYMTEAIRFYETHRHTRANKIPVTVKTQLLLGRIMRQRYGVYYSAKAHNLVRTLRAAYDTALNEFDILVMPTTPMKAHPLLGPDPDEREIMARAVDTAGNTAPFDVTGHPSMSVPAGFSDGRPVGMMLTGRNGQDDVVLRTGDAFERLA